MFIFYKLESEKKLSFNKKITTKQLTHSKNKSMGSHLYK